LPAISATIRENEINGGSPYVLGFAQKGQSGASFGFMQGDMHVSQLARDTMGQVLTAAGTPQAKIAEIMAALTPALPNGNPLNAADTSTVNAALNSASGQPLVDAMDQQLLQGVLHGVDACVAAAQTRAMTLAPLAYLYIAPWINMSGPPSLMLAWLKGAPVNGVPAPGPPTVEADEVIAYLQSLAYFQQHPKNFAHYQQCVQKSAALLP
jgi:hypothetical protein